MDLALRLTKHGASPLPPVVFVFTDYPLVNILTACPKVTTLTKFLCHLALTEKKGVSDFTIINITFSLCKLVRLLFHFYPT